MSNRMLNARLPKKIGPTSLEEEEALASEAQDIGEAWDELDDKRSSSGTDLMEDAMRFESTTDESSRSSYWTFGRTA